MSGWQPGIEDHIECSTTANAQAAEVDEEEEDFEDAVDRKSEPDYDGDEDEDEVVNLDKDGKVNSQLAVGGSFDKSFVVRGDKIGVFKHTDDN